LAAPALSAAARWWRGAVVALVAVFVGFAVAYALLIPLGNSPDELSHLNYVRLIAHHAALPPTGVREHQQPPLFYLLGAALLWAGAPEQSLRLISVAAGAAGVIAGALIARNIAPRRPVLAVGAAGFLALLPGSQFVAGSISDDGLAIAVGAWVLLVCVLVVKAPAPSGRLLAAAGAVTGVALITKQTDWAPLAALLVAIVWHWRTKLRWRHAAPLAGLALLIAGWWYARNLVTFHSVLPPLVHGDKLQLNQARGFVSQTARSWFRPERFQGGLITLPRAGVVVEEVLIATLFAVMLYAAYRAVRAWPALQPWQRSAMVALCAAAVLAVASSVVNSATVIIQPQGMYLLTAAAAPALAAGAVLASGVARRPRLTLTLAGLCAAAAMALSAIGLHTSLVAYG